MKKSDIYEIRDLLQLDHDQIRELIERYRSENDTDFELAGARIIRADAIDAIQQDELLSDLYCLGCFNAHFLANYLPISADAIRKIQDAGAYEAVGEIVKEYIADIQEGYAAADGYGHHFNGYDFSEYAIGPYLIFPRARE